MLNKGILLKFTIAVDGIVLVSFEIFHSYFVTEIKLWPLRRVTGYHNKREYWLYNIWYCEYGAYMNGAFIRALKWPSWSEFHITSHFLCSASGGAASNSPSHVLYMGVSYSC